MKHIIVLLVLLALGCSTLFAQQTVTPSQINPAISSSQTVASQTGKNSIISYTYRNGSSPSDANANDANIDIQYFDGLGRPIETVAVKASPTGQDIIALQTYDNYGRNNKSYLPITNTSLDSGAFATETQINSVSKKTNFF